MGGHSIAVCTSAKVRLFERWLRTEVQSIEKSWEQFYNSALNRNKCVE